jgi:hypothetical protein
MKGNPFLDYSSRTRRRKDYRGHTVAHRNTAVSEREPSEIRELAEQAGISFSTLRRAKDALGVRSHKAGMSALWMWILPERCSHKRLERLQFDIADSIFEAHRILAAFAPMADGVLLSKLLIIAVRLSDGARPRRLQLDSGTNAPSLYNTTAYMALGLTWGKSLLRSGVDGTAYSALPPLDVKIGSLKLPGVLFVTLVRAQNDSRTSEFDGRLATGLFRRVFISLGHS